MPTASSGACPEAPLTHSPSSWILAPNSYRYSNTSNNLANGVVKKLRLAFEGPESRYYSSLWETVDRKPRRVNGERLANGHPDFR
jgi:hypothetical protein